MSIIIRSNELNTIVYKYLLEAGLTHTAYVMFNQARLQASLQEFKFDIKSGHLLSLLQKALIFNQVQSHVNFNQYTQCSEPFSLLKSHTCKLTQKIKKDSDQFMKQLNNNLVECMKRTNAIYNTELSNPKYNEIIYEPRGANYFDKFEKFKFRDSSDDDYMERDELRRLVQIDGEKDGEMAVWNRQENVVYVTENDSFGEPIISKMYPCCLNGQLQPLETFKLTPDALIMVFPSNRCKIIFREQSNRQLQFSLPFPATSIYPNPNISSLICFQSETFFTILNTKNMQQILTAEGLFNWRNFDQYIICSSSKMQLRSLLKSQPIIDYCLQQTTVSELSVSTNRTFFFTLSYQKNKLTKSEPLYVFNFAEEDEDIRKVIWLTRNGVDYLAILTDLAVRVWEVEFNAYCLRIDLSKYKLGEAFEIRALEKNDAETFLLVLGEQNMIVSDVANQKIERIESPINANQMQNVGRNHVFLSTDENIYFLNGQKLTELFK